MSAFEFFFSFYGLLLGLSVAALATGLAIAIQNRRKIRVGWLTPLLALFVALDVASFWDFAWTVYRAAPFSYGLLVGGLAIALTYFLAASLVFPYEVTDDMSLDDHFWANKRVVLLLTSAANILVIAIAIPILLASEAGQQALIYYAFGLLFYLVLMVPAALARKARLFAVMTGLHVALYLLIAALSAAYPEQMAAVVSEAEASATAAP